jgi:uncharacterized protein (DUF1778 family)
MAMSDAPSTDDGRVQLDVRVPVAQAQWIAAAAEKTGQTPSELVQQAIQLLRKASSYKGEVGS